MGQYAPTNSKEMTDYEGAWVYPRYVSAGSVPPKSLTTGPASGAECFRAIADQVARRCADRVDPMSVIGRRAANPLGKDPARSPHLHNQLPRKRLDISSSSTSR